MQEGQKEKLSIQFNMPNAQELAQERFVWGISNSDDSGGGSQRIEKQTPPSQPSHMLETQIVKAAKGKKRTKRNGENHAEESHEHEIHIWTERERRKKMKDMFSKLHALLPQIPPKADKSTIVDEAVSSIKSLEQTLEKLQMQKLEKLRNSSALNTSFAFAPSSSSSPTTLLTPISNHPQALTVGTSAADSYSREAFLADHISSSGAAAVNLPYPCNDPIPAFSTWSSHNIVLNICGNEAFFIFCCPKDKLGVFTSVSGLFEKYNMEVLFANVTFNVFRRIYMIQAQVNPSYESQLLANGFGVREIFKQAAQELELLVLSL